MLPSDRALATLYTLNSNPVSVCSGLIAIINGKFQAINGRISETVRDRTNVSMNQVIETGIRPFTLHENY